MILARLSKIKPEQFNQRYKVTSTLLLGSTLTTLILSLANHDRQSSVILRIYLAETLGNIVCVR